MSFREVCRRRKMGHLYNKCASVELSFLWLAKHNRVERFLKCHCFLAAPGSGKVWQCYLFPLSNRVLEHNSSSSSGFIWLFTIVSSVANLSASLIFSIWPSYTSKVFLAYFFSFLLSILSQWLLVLIGWYLLLMSSTTLLVIKKWFLGLK